MGSPRTVPANELCQIIITVPLDGRQWLQHISVYASRRSLPSNNRPLEIKHNRIQHPKIDPPRVESLSDEVQDHFLFEYLPLRIEFARNRSLEIKQNRASER